MEMLDIVDEHGVPTGKIADRKKIHLEGIMHRTAHVWLLRKREGKVEILLQKRSSIKDSFPGCYDISSAGHIPAGCDYVESAIREMKEELGIDILPEELVFCGDRTVVWDGSFNGTPFHDRQYSRVFIVWKDLEEKDFVLQKEEVDSVRWIGLDECIKAVREDKIKHCIYPEELDMVKSKVENTGGNIHGNN